jgi:septal ring-binding cell division protein DamX
MNTSHLAAFVAALVCAAAVAWLATSDHPIVAPGLPRTKAGAVKRLEAAPPVIPEYAKFNVNDENPFVPYNERLAEKRALQERPKPTAPLRAAVEVVGPVAKPLPRLGQSVGLPPAVMGVMTRDGARQVAVRDGDADRWVAVGGEVQGWTLSGVDEGPVVLWLDQRGRVLRQLVAGSDAVIKDEVFRSPKQEAPVPAKPAATPAAKPATMSAAKPEPQKGQKEEVRKMPPMPFPPPYPPLPGQIPPPYLPR